MQHSDRLTMLVSSTGRMGFGRVIRDAWPPERPLKEFADPAIATAWLKACDPHAILVDLEPAEAEPFILTLRAIPRLSCAPVILLASDICNSTFARAYAWGADDVVDPADIDGVTRRLHSIPEDHPLGPPPCRGRAVLAHSDPKARILLGRVLRNAGLDVQFATDANELAKSARGAGVMLVVADDELDQGQAANVLKVAKRSPDAAPWVILAGPGNLGGAWGAVLDMPGVAVQDSHAPPENLQFIANEILSGSSSEQRASARLLYSTLVAFRTAGRDQDRLGFAYNVSEEGVFIRTLDPLPRGDVAWLELTPPRTDRRVRLEGPVAWARTLGPWAGATVPAGFGVHLTGGSSADLKRFRDGYQAFSRDQAGRKWSTTPAAGLE